MTQFVNNPYYVQYERLLEELSHLMAEGKGDTDEADAIRDEMDVPWYKLSQEETDRMRGVSADLYMLQDDEVYESYKGTQEELRAALSEALGRNDYEAILALLRKGTSFLRPVQVASLRGRCYAALGHPDTALLFLRYAAAHDPDRAAYRVAVLDLLLKLHRPDDALAEAETCLQTVEEPLLLAA